MAIRQLRFPDEVSQLLARSYQNQHRDWLVGGGEWPLGIALGTPNENEAIRHGDVVRDWVTAWQGWHGIGNLTWCDRQWRSVGTQRLPERLQFNDPTEIATWLGQAERWNRAVIRYRRLTSHWARLGSALPRYFDLLADYDEMDFQRLEDMLTWLEANPDSNLYPRQLPIAGLDSKWLNGRKSVIADLLNMLRDGVDRTHDFFQCCGLKQLPATIRVRILDPYLRGKLSGLGDVSAPLEELASLVLPATQVFIVENLQSGMAFDDLPGSVVITALGYGVDVLGRLPWAMSANCFYWGDIDTHGFAILSRARSYMPNIKSLLMDESTLMTHKQLWVREEKPNPLVELPHLTDAEQKVYLGLKQHCWGTNVRLEQERIAWDYAWKVIHCC